MTSAVTEAGTDGPGLRCIAPDTVIEDISTGMFASGFGHFGDGRPFSFHVHRAQLVVEVYRPRAVGPVPLPEDVVAAVRRPLAGVDAGNARSLAAAVRDMISTLGPLAR